MRRFTIVVMSMSLAGCCTYQGKHVSRRQAEHMRTLGMPVQCPGDAEPGPQLRPGGDVLHKGEVPDICDTPETCNVGKQAWQR
jgi:hypothetical protein